MQNSIRIVDNSRRTDGFTGPFTKEKYLEGRFRIRTQKDLDEFTREFKFQAKKFTDKLK